MSVWWPNFKSLHYQLQPTRTHKGDESDLAGCAGLPARGLLPAAFPVACKLDLMGSIVKQSNFSDSCLVTY